MGTNDFNFYNSENDGYRGGFGDYTDPAPTGPSVSGGPEQPRKRRGFSTSTAALLLACAVVVLRTMLDDTYKTAEDIRKYAGLVVLASIPLADAGEQPKEKSEFKRRTKRFANDVRRRVGGSSGRKA